MGHKYKRGDVVVVTYTSQKGEKFRSSGIVLELSDLILKIGHNFEDNFPIDVTEIAVGSILKSELIPLESVREINSPTDLVT